MSVVTVTAVNVLNNPAPFTAPLEFEVHYEAFQDLEEDVEWKLVYVGSADSENQDQELESVLVGPVMSGKYKFVFQADAPDPSKIPKDDLVGLTAVLLSCSYREQEFLRIGYFVRVEFEDEKLKEDPPANPKVEQLQRNLLESDPRITHYAIDWPKHVQITPEVSTIYPPPPVEPEGNVQSDGKDVVEGSADDVQTEGGQDGGDNQGDSGSDTGLEVEVLEPLG
ncbi:hypothetical protein BSKO_07909 [Bryopsis sp. KO-2023]|nr:hypothetical protein BSKO_07909 [Bryopsis sp. KO-2023]